MRMRKLIAFLRQEPDLPIGKTVIVATHDDRYFDIADRVLQVTSGRLA